mgnify:CR=1 FL=1
MNDAPDVEILSVIRVSFRRGAGTSNADPVRIVSRYYLRKNAVILFEDDPMKAEGGHIVPPGMREAFGLGPLDARKP